MNQSNQPSGSSELEGILVGEPLSDVSLVIVHVNEHYESVGCCEGVLKRLLEARVAANVYEHAAQHQSFLKDFLGLDWKAGDRYSDFELGGVSYYIVDNETEPGNYEIDGLQGRRLILVGGGRGNCHKRATDAVAEQLYELLKTDKIREVHLPVDCIYDVKKEYE